MNEEITPNKIKPGIYFEISNEDYHQGEGISKSALDNINRSPAHYIASLKAPREETRSLIIGSAVHAAILEPDVFREKYVVAPDINKRTNAGKAEYAAFIMENVGKKIIEQEIYDMALNIRDVVFTHPKASRLLSPPKGITSVAESSIYWHDEGLMRSIGVDDEYVLCKCRPDFFRSDMITVDVKTTQDARISEFQRSVAKYRYHVQGAYYTNGIETAYDDNLREFLFLCVETTPPYGVAIYNMDDDAFFAGKYAYEDNLRTYVRCKQTGIWPGYPDEIQTLQLPRWAA